MRVSSVKKPSPAMVVALIALFVALSGAAYAVVKPGKNTVGPKQVKNDSLTGNEIAKDSIEGVDVDENTLSLPAQGPTTPSGAAGGDLSGNYPSPSIANNAVNSAKIANGSVGPDDVALGTQWREIGTAGNPGFNLANSGECTWKNYDAAHQSAAFTRDAAGFVHLKGLVDAEDVGGGNCLFTDGFNDELIFELPAGYRPALRSIHTTNANNTFARVNIDGPPLGYSAGAVSVDAVVTPANARAFVSLDGISFRCSPSGANGCP